MATLYCKVWNVQTESQCMTVTDGDGMINVTGDKALFEELEVVLLQ